MKTHFFLSLLFVSMLTVVNAQCPRTMITDGDNLIQDGAFNYGDKFFESDYEFRRSFFVEIKLDPGQFSVQLNPFYANQDFASCIGWDKKDNSMMVIDGDDNVGALIWGQEVEVEKGRMYNLTFYVATLRDLGSGPITFDVAINDKVLGTVEHSQIGTCNWEQYKYNWKATVSGKVKLKFINQFDYGPRGNDFILDDLAFYACKDQTLDDLTALLEESLIYEAKPKVVVVNDKEPEGIKEPLTIVEQIKEHSEGKLSAVTLNNVFFESGKSTLKQESFDELDMLASIMNGTHKNIKIEISGHTDNVGSESSNLALSRNRARSVMNYLLQKKVAYSRMKSLGFGSTKPVATNDTEEGRQKNRRVEFKILD